MSTLDSLVNSTSWLLNAGRLQGPPPPGRVGAASRHVRPALGGRDPGVRRAVVADGRQVRLHLLLHPGLLGAHAGAGDGGLRARPLLEEDEPHRGDRVVFSAFPIFLIVFLRELYGVLADFNIFNLSALAFLVFLGVGVGISLETPDAAAPNPDTL